MGLVAVLAFCAMTSAGQGAPTPPYECVFIENSNVQFETQTACTIEVMRLRRDPIVRMNAESVIVEKYGPQEQLTWYVWCHPEEDLKNFYRHFGVGDLGDIPDES